MRGLPSTALDWTAEGYCPHIFGGHSSQTGEFLADILCAMTPESLVRAVEGFLAEARDAVVLEDGAVAFDLAQAKYSISGDSNKCLLHLWSPERNVVRRVLEAEVSHEVLRLAVQRLGQSKPTKLEICRQRDRRTQPQSGLRVCLTRHCCGEPWSDAFPDSAWPSSRLRLTSSDRLVLSTLAVFCGMGSRRLRCWG
jgi:hypothetical protein